MTYLEDARALYNEMVANRRHLHRNPELGFDLPKTVAFVKDKLTEYGLEPHDIGDHGITALIGKPGGKTVLLRADMDALPIVEQSGLEFSSTNDYSHTCGHDMHTSILLAVAKLLKANEDQLQGYVKFIFQPAEELLIGGKAMLEAGILENPKVDAAFGLHVAPNAPLQGIIYRPGPAMSSALNFRIRIKGSGTHGAMPHLGIDPVYIGSQVVNGLTAIPARELGLDQNAAVTIGRFEGLGAMNIIPDEVVLEGTARTLSENSRAYLRDRLPQLASSIVETYRGQAEFEFIADCPVLHNNEDLTTKAVDILKDKLPENLPILPFSPQLASEDFAYYANQVPAFFFNLCNPYDPTANDLHPVHHPKVVFGEDMMPIGVASFAYLATEWLAKHA
ncbi:M20 metallopeptidase family protein [Streptococcus caprae]|uniref:M20 family metallopeptidase n=1 Tax=Streptococcus caprae TaxID=1640501 RepID=A0ABV8CVY6_9STRE